MLIRDEQPGDAHAIRAVVEAAFSQPLEADLVDRLRGDGDVAISLVATDDSGVVGHILLSKMTAPFRALGLAPVSVRPDRQGTGIGSQLIRAGLERAKEGGWQAVFVLGEPAYYTRFGFDPALASGFTSPYAGAYLMAISLDGDLPVTSGIIEYAPAFTMFE